MSRCYPFPPPGYELKTMIIDLSAKVKHAEKKHKKEKRDKEKREHKEKRDKKDRIKDKHKKKKDRKHKVRKKEKNRNNGRTSEDRKAEGLSQVHNELHIKENWQKTDEGKDSKFEKELDKRNKDDGAENPMVGSFANSVQRKFEGAGAANESLENERVAASRVFSGQVGSVQRRNDRTDPPIENFSKMEKEKCGERSLVSNSVVPGPDRRKVLGARTLAPSSLSTSHRRKDVLGMPVENLSSSRIEGMDTVPTIKKERANGGAIFPHHVVQKDIHQKVEKTNKIQVKKAEDRQGHKNSYHSVQKSEANDKDRITKEKKKEENIVENAKAIMHNKFRNHEKKDQVDILNCKPLAPHKDNTIGIEFVDRTMKKRKNLDTNGGIKENDERPTKTPKMTSASQSLVNGKPSESPSTISLNSGAINNLRPDRLLETKARMKNGNAISQNSDVSLVLLAHPDSKHLSQIYTVPKMAELPEFDDQEWLFNFHDSLQKPKTELRAEIVPQVFARAMRIDSADIVALPYVVPF